MIERNLRRPPAYQVYASDDLANSAYYGLSAAERGLLDSMQRACWVEDHVPRDTSLLARVLRLPEADVTINLTPQVLAHFEEVVGSNRFLRSRELSRQMANIMEGRQKMSSGGRKGASTTNRKRSLDDDRERGHDKAEYPASHPATYLAPHPAGSERGREGNAMSRTELKRIAVSTKKANKVAILPGQNEWADEYSDAERQFGDERKGHLHPSKKPAGRQ